MKKEKQKKWSASELKKRIEARHPLEKSWAVFNEVGAASGTWRKAGSIDAVAVCLSAPRDFAVHGFEVKVSRSDWLSELNNPNKNSIAIQEVDFWWIVAPSVEVVKVEELPDKWGLYTCSGMGLCATKRAKRIKPAGGPLAGRLSCRCFGNLVNGQQRQKKRFRRLSMGNTSGDTALLKKTQGRM